MSTIRARNFRVFFIGLLILAAIIGFAIYEVALWRECIPNHPWWYCLRLLVR